MTFSTWRELYRRGAGSRCEVRELPSISLPHGVSGVVIVSVIHLAIHTFLNMDMRSIDVFTCGTRINPKSCNFRR